MGKLVIPLTYTKGKLKMESDNEAKTFSVEIPKYASINIHHSEKHIGVTTKLGAGSKGLFIEIPEAEVIKLLIKIEKEEG